MIVRNGAEAIRYAMADVRFQVIFMDLRMPIINGDDASRMIRSTKNLNSDTPIVAVTAFDQDAQDIQTGEGKEGDLFAWVLAKPVEKNHMIQCLRGLGLLA